jgi:hypothetical protein
MILSSYSGYGKDGKIPQTISGCIPARSSLANRMSYVREIHTRMPVILPEEHHDSWLSGEAGKEISVPFPADRMKAWPVSRRVNSPKNNDDAIIAPVEVESVARQENLPQLL